MARRFVGLTALRWVPTGLLIPVTVLLLQSRGLSLAEIGLLSAVQSLTVLVLELPTGGLADALGRRPVLVVAGVLDVAALALLAVGRSFSVLALAWFLQGVFRALESGPLEAWFVDTSLAADPAAPIERGLARASTAIGLAISAGALTAALLGVASPTDPFTTAVAIALGLRVADVAALHRYVDEAPHRAVTAAIPLAAGIPPPTAAATAPPEASSPQRSDATATPDLEPARSDQDAGHPPPEAQPTRPDADHPAEDAALPSPHRVANISPAASPDGDHPADASSPRHADTQLPDGAPADSPEGAHPAGTVPTRPDLLPARSRPGTAAVPVADPNPPFPQPDTSPSPSRHADTTAAPDLEPARSRPPTGSVGTRPGCTTAPARPASDPAPSDRLGAPAAEGRSSDPPDRRRPRLERIRRAFAEVPGVVAGAVRLVAGEPALLALVGVELLWGAGLVTVELLSAPRLVELLGSRSEGLVVFGIVAALGWSIAGIGSAFTSRVVGWHGGAAWRAGASLRIAQGLAVLGIALVAGPAGLVAGYLGFYLVHGAANTVHYGMVHRLVGPEHRTTVVSANSLTSRIGSLAAAAGLGALANAHGIPAACLVAAALLAAGAPLYRIAGRTTA